MVKVKARRGPCLDPAHAAARSIIPIAAAVLGGPGDWRTPCAASSASTSARRRPRRSSSTRTRTSSAAASPIRARTTTRRRRRQAGGAGQRPLPPLPPGAGEHQRAERLARRLHRPARARLPRRAVSRAARRPRGDLPPQPGDGRFGDAPARWARRWWSSPPDGRGAGAVRARREAEERLLPRHRRQPVPADRRGRRQGGQGRATTSAQRLRPLDHRGREPRLRRFDPAPPARRARAQLRRAARDAGARAQVEAPIKGILDTEMEETYVVGTGYGRARLPFSQGAHPFSEILCHGLGAHVMYPGTRRPCSTSAARTPRRSRSTRPASSRTSR